VLVGDAAGYNDPIIGQGLPITLRDVRMVRDALLGARAWSPAIFEGYAEERRERLRRLRLAARFIQRLHAGFEGAALARRLHALGVLEREPALGLPVLQAVFAGPETVAPEWFTPAYVERVFGAGADAPR
jgi:menaquinone-9 beta-reductase